MMEDGCVFSKLLKYPSPHTTDRPGILTPTCATVFDSDFASCYDVKIICTSSQLGLSMP